MFYALLLDVEHEALMQVGPRCCWFCPIAQFYGMHILILHHFCIIFDMAIGLPSHHALRCTGAF